MTTFYLVRHGESEWNAAGLLQGQTTHVGLTPRGREQAAAASHELPDPVEVLLTSDLARAVQTAEIIGALTGVWPRPEPALRERSYGRLEGGPAHVRLDEARVLAAGGESASAVRTRVAAVLQRCLDERLESVVIVSHGDTIRAALAWLGSATAEVPANGSVTVVDLVAA